MSIKICLYSVTYFRVSQARMLMLRSYIKPKQCNRQKLKHATLVFVLHLITNESFQLAYFLVYLSRISDGLNEKNNQTNHKCFTEANFQIKTFSWHLSNNRSKTQKLHFWLVFGNQHLHH